MQKTTCNEQGSQAKSVDQRSWEKSGEQTAQGHEGVQKRVDVVVISDLHWVFEFPGNEVLEEIVKLA